MEQYKYDTFLEYSQVFGSIKNENDIISIIKQIHFDFACKVLSTFGFYDKKYDREIIKNFLISKCGNEEAFLESNSHVITRANVLMAWKYLLVYNDLCLKSLDQEEIQIEKLLQLLLMINEVILKENVKEEQVNNFLSANAYFNYYDSTHQMAIRSYYMFIKNKRNSSNVNMSEWNGKFAVQHNGISIDKYIYLVYLMVTYIEKRDNHRKENNVLIMNDWYINPRTIPAVSSLTKKDLRLILNNLSFTIEEGKEWCEKHTHDLDCISLFINKPLLKVNSNCYIPLERKCFNELLFYSLFYKIKYSVHEDKKYFSDFGKIFEEYIDYICYKTCAISQGFYEPIPEFKFSSNKLSPDYMILNRNTVDTVMVIESKSARILYEVNDYFNLNINKFKKSQTKTYYKPLNQSMQAISSIVEEGKNEYITKDKVYYFVSVTMSNLPFKLTGEYIPISNYSNLKIGGYISINIEELELFFEVLVSPNANPFGWYIEKYRDYSSNSFKNFLMQFEKSENNFLTGLAYELKETANAYFGTLK